MTEMRSLMEAIPRWLALSRISAPNLGLERNEARSRAAALLDRLERDGSLDSRHEVTAEEIDVLYAAVELLSEESNFSRRCARGYPLYLLARSLRWPDPLGEQDDLLHGLGNLLRRPVREEDLQAAAQLLGTLEGQSTPGHRLELERPEILGAIVQLLWERLESAPESVRADAAFLFHYLAEPFRPIGVTDEREYFLGEFALIAGLQCRFMSRRDEARLWFDRAEANFRLTVRLHADLSRLAYQRLALRVEERAYEEVLELVEPLQESFGRLGMRDASLKCRFLVCACLKELDRVDEAIAVAEEASREAQRIGDERLFAQAQNNLFLYYADSGNVEAALQCCNRAASSLTALGNRIGLAKMQFFAANLLRSSARSAEALPAYRIALSSFRELGMRGDVAAMHLVIADLLLEQGAEAQAEWEIRAALPIIDEEKMVPEGMAAYALLRESVRRRKIDRGALRDVHGYFQS